MRQEHVPPQTRENTMLTGGILGCLEGMEALRKDHSQRCACEEPRPQCAQRCEFSLRHLDKNSLFSPHVIIWRCPIAARHQS